MSLNSTITQKSSTWCRLNGVVLLLLYLLVSVVAPLVHMVDHDHHDHAHFFFSGHHGHDHHDHHHHAHHHHHHPEGGLDSLLSRSELRVEAFRDSESGKVDFGALAAALGLDDHLDGHDHEHCEDSHSKGAPFLAGHAAEHFALAYLSAESVQLLPEALILPLPKPLPLLSLQLPPRPQYLDISYPQGPPETSLRA